jgi:hypothetical protein
VCLSLRGFYVKIGQVMSGQPDMLPAPYSESLKVLQENVPHKPFPTIKGIVESELGCAMDVAFSSFEEEPIGAASIGQVHRATLRSGERVVVKVQYPETEAYFAMDFATIMRIFEVVNPEMVEILEEQKACFEQEFDYKQEAANLRRMCDEVRPFFRGLRFPEPYDAKHPRFPKALANSGIPLVTKRLLVMDEMPGRTVTKFGSLMLADAAAKEGVTPDEFKKNLMDKMSSDPDFAVRMMSAVPSEAQFEWYRRGLLAKDLARRALAAAYNWTAAPLGYGRMEAEPSLVPPNVSPPSPLRPLRSPPLLTLASLTRRARA